MATNGRSVAATPACGEAAAAWLKRVELTVIFGRYVCARARLPRQKRGCGNPRRWFFAYPGGLDLRVALPRALHALVDIGQGLRARLVLPRVEGKA